MSYNLGISCFFHDSSCALIDDNGVICAAEEERFTRKKHDSSFPVNAINFCMKERNLSIDDIDNIIFYENPINKFDRIFNRFIKNLPRSLKLLPDIASQWHNEKLWFKEICVNKLKVNKEKIKYFDHHLSHCYSALLPSGFDDAACLTIDGVGEWSTTNGYFFKNGKIKKIFSINFPNSLGILYSAFTEFLGFEVNDGEYKVMGMAAYGKPIYIDKINNLFKSKSLNDFKLDLDYFTFEYSNKSNLSKKFLDLFGPPRIKESEFLKKDQTSPLNYEINEDQKYYADIAASIQYVIEKQVVDFTVYLKKTTNSKNLVYAGGVAYNGVINEKLIKNKLFENIYIQPAAGDNGASIGAALGYAYENKLSKKFTLNNMYLGKKFNHKDCLETIKNYSFNYQKYNALKEQVEFISNKLIDEKIFGIFNSRFEFGPRALGNRSIVADPRKIESRNIINRSVKYREQFRPFAPVVLDEKASLYFELDENLIKKQPYKYMLAVTKVRENFVNVLPAITHVDGTARIQILKEEDNFFLYQLIQSFGEKTGVYCLINTSFNVRGDPIVNTPNQALQTFANSDIDYLSIENIVVSK